MSTQTPRDLANFVYGRIDNTATRPSADVLETVFNTLFLASLKTEERNPIRCSIALIDSRGPDPEPPRRIRDHRWTCTSLGKPVPFSVANLSKLALAADPTSSTLAVASEKSGKLTIRGLFDQQGGLTAWLRHEREGTFGPPGIIQAQVLDIGHIVVTDNLEVIAELNGGVLIENTVDVFAEGTINQRLQPGLDQRIESISNRVAEEGYELEEEDLEKCSATWTRTLKRILLKARDFSHGGAFLVTGKPLHKHLDVKHSFQYDRIPQLFENWMSSRIIYHHSWAAIHDEYEDDQDHINPDLYFQNAVAENSREDANDALAGAIGLVAALSRVDGLVLLDGDLRVQGFGCEIIAKGDTEAQPYFAQHARPTAARVTKLDIQKFGTRHRSMIRYCSEDKGAVGFVISSDGPVRSIARTGKRTYFWPNIQLGMTRG